MPSVKELKETRESLLIEIETLKRRLNQFANLSSIDRHKIAFEIKILRNESLAIQKEIIARILLEIKQSGFD